MACRGSHRRKETHSAPWHRSDVQALAIIGNLRLPYRDGCLIMPMRAGVRLLQVVNDMLTLTGTAV